MLGSIIDLIVNSYFEYLLVGGAINRECDPGRPSLKQDSVARKPALSPRSLDAIENYEFIRSGNFIKEPGPGPEVRLVNRQFQGLRIMPCFVGMLGLLPLTPVSFEGLLPSCLESRTLPMVQARARKLVRRRFSVPHPLFLQVLRSDCRIIRDNASEVIVSARNFQRISLRT